jgi:hypothetical protein
VAEEAETMKKLKDKLKVAAKRKFKNKSIEIGEKFYKKGIQKDFVKHACINELRKTR